MTREWNGHSLDLPQNSLLTVPETANPDNLLAQFDQDLRDKEKKVGETNRIWFLRGLERTRFGLRHQIIGKMAKQPFLAVQSPFFQSGEGLAGIGFQAIVSAGGQQAFESGVDAGRIAVIV